MRLKTFREVPDRQRKGRRLFVSVLLLLCYSSGGFQYWEKLPSAAATRHTEKTVGKTSLTAPGGNRQRGLRAGFGRSPIFDPSETLLSPLQLRDEILVGAGERQFPAVCQSGLFRDREPEPGTLRIAAGFVAAYKRLF